MSELKKKYTWDSEALVSVLLNKWLEKYNTTIEEILKLPEHKIDGVLWCSYYKMTMKERDEWVDWCCKFIKDNVRNPGNKEYIRKRMQWIDLMWGPALSDYKLEVSPKDNNTQS